MKKFTVLFLFISAISFAQVIEIGQYRMGYLMKTLPIRYIQEEKKFAIQTITTDDYASNTILYLPENKRQQFIDNFKKAKEKFVEWKKTAEENKVDDVIKDIDTSHDEYEVWFDFGNDIYSDLHALTGFRFTVNRGIPLLIFSNLVDLRDYDNQYIKSKGFYLVFESDSEIDRFLFWLDPKVAEIGLKKAKEKTDIFK